MSESPIRVLMLEDDAADAELIQTTLEVEGISADIVRVQTRADLFAALEGHEFDIILSDYNMPGFDGMTALALTREKFSNIPFILVSGTLGEDVAIESLKGGASDYVMKGRLARLAPAVRRALKEFETQRARSDAEAALRRRARIAFLSAEIGRILLHGDEVEAMLRDCAESIIRNLDAAFAKIWEFDGDEGFLVLRASAGAYTSISGGDERIPLGETEIGRIAETRKPLLLNTAFQTSPAHQEGARPINAVSFAGIPIAIRDRLFGVVAIAARDALTEVDMAGLEAICVKIALGIERKRSSEALRESERRFSDMLDNVELVSLMLDCEGRVTYCNDFLLRLTGWTLDELLGRNWFEAVLPPERVPELKVLFSALLKGSALERHYENEILTRAGDRRLIRWSNSVLYSERGEVIGTASIGEDVTDHRRAEERVRRQLENIGALRKIDMAITGSLDLRIMLSVILDQVVTQLQIDAAAVFLFHQASQTLEYGDGRGFRTSALGQAALHLGEGYAGRCAASRSMIYIPDLRQASADLVRAKEIREEGFVGYIAVPLLSKGQVKGVLEVYHRTVLDRTKEWHDFLQILAGQVAIAIDNAGLFDDLQRTNADLLLAYDKTLEGWSHALDLRDKETEGHTERVTELTLTLARSMNIGNGELAHIRRGALLHDVGKLGIPDSILLKQGPLTEDEWVTMRKHPVYAYEWLYPIPFLRPALDIPYCHHEKWDGTGYPRGLKGELIPLAARVFSIVDVWDALRSDRPYRKGWPREKVLAHIQSLIGTHFEPRVAEAFLKLDV